MSTYTWHKYICPLLKLLPFIQTLIHSYLQDLLHNLQHQSPPTLIHNCLQREVACTVSHLVLIKKHSARKDWVAPALEGAKENKAGTSDPQLLCWGWEKGSIVGWETAHQDVNLCQLPNNNNKHWINRWDTHKGKQGRELKMSKRRKRRGKKKRKALDFPAF